LRHLMIAIALLAVLGLDGVFIHFSGSAAAALTFAVLGYLILLLLSGTAGTFVSRDRDQDALQERNGVLDDGLWRMAARVLLGASVPALLMLAVVYIPDLDRSLVPSQAIRLGTSAATFGLLAALPLAGVALGFLRPSSGALEAVLVGGAALADYAMLSWGTLGVDGAALQLALYDLMLWPVLALIGAWVGMSLRQVAQTQMVWMCYPAQPARPAEDAPVVLAPTRAAEYPGETPTAECQTYQPGRRGFTGA
jgi:hypothetical protein